MNCVCRRVLSSSIVRLAFNCKILRNTSYISSSGATSSLPIQTLQFENFNQIRHKSKKSKEDLEDEEENFNIDSSLNKDSKIVKFNTGSLRTDLILKSALGVARNKIEQLFYESKIRVNGRKIMKKSASVKVGDEVDVIKMVSPKNTDHLYVSRVEILKVEANEDSITLTVRRFKNLLIENYEDDPYKGTSETE